MSSLSSQASLHQQGSDWGYIDALIYEAASFHIRIVDQDLEKRSDCCTAEESVAVDLMGR